MAEQFQKDPVPGGNGNTSAEKTCIIMRSSGRIFEVGLLHDKPQMAQLISLKGGYAKWRTIS